MNKGRTRPSEQSSEIVRSDLLRSLTVPALIALAYKNEPRTLQVARKQENLIYRPIPQKVFNLGQVQRPQQVLRDKQKSTIQTYRDAFKLPQKLSVVKKTLCQRRSERREQLFRMGTAGAGRRRSPGQGGSYKRNEKSRISC